MKDRSQEFAWYLLGCDRLDRTPVSREEFETLWQEYEDYAESLKSAESAGTLAELDHDARKKMEARIQADPLLKAVLVGQAELSGQ